MLLEFLKSWLEWAEGKRLGQGAPYTACAGLCLGTLVFGRHKGMSTGEAKHLRDELRGRLREDFPKLAGMPEMSGTSAGSAALYPFNVGNAKYYGNESAVETCHKNPERLAWVRKTIKELEVWSTT